MFVRIISLLLLFLVTCSAQNGCPPNSNIKPLRAHETDCDKFYQCSNGRDFLFTCGPGTVFDERLQVCNWPSAVSCKTKPSLKKPAKSSEPPKKDAKTPLKATKPKDSKKVSAAKDTKKPSPVKATGKPTKA